MRDYVMVTRKQDERQKVAVIPDSYFALLTPRRAHFFLELDYATEPLSDWKIKIKAYQAYTKSSGDRPSLYQKRYGTSAIRVLTVTTSALRLAHLKEVTEQAEGKARYWFTTFDQVAPDTILTAPIWQYASAEKFVPLISPDPKAESQRSRHAPV